MDTLSYYPSDTTIGGLLFSNYTSEEIRRLSVKELTSSQAIDRLGAPVPGGPYDLALGPFDKNDRCFTCGQGFVACPGHLGHISLVLPVYNPVFFRNLVNVLRGCCLHCHTILCSHAEKYLFSMQMLYLKQGQSDELEALQSIYKNWILEKKSLQVFYEQMNEHIEANPIGSNGSKSTTKNLLAMRQQLIKDFETRALKAKSNSSSSLSPVQTLLFRTLLSQLQHSSADSARRFQRQALLLPSDLHQTAQSLSAASVQRQVSSAGCSSCD